LSVFWSFSFEHLLVSNINFELLVSNINFERFLVSNINFERFLEFNSFQTREVNTMKQVAPLRYDVIFKKAFSHPALFTAISKDFLGIQLEIDKVEHDKAFVPPVGSVATKFDLFAEDKKNRVIVEVQHAHYSDSYERFLYYQCSAMVETIVSSSNYRFPMTVMTIVFFTGNYGF
jgi:hypothetical protein